MRILLLYISIILTSCTSSPDSTELTKPVITPDYELSIAPEQKALLILFPCFPCDAANTNTEFEIVEACRAKNISVLLMNFNLHLSMTSDEKATISSLLISTLEKYKIPMNNTYIGGFSSGGNVTVLLSDYLIKENLPLQPRGIFIVDSPIDLYQLYTVAQANIKADFSEVSVTEAKWIIDKFNIEFGSPDTAMGAYIKNSPYIAATHSPLNTSHLKDLKIRLYTEPDTLWWQENRHVTYEQMNAFALENLAIDLKAGGAKNVEFITTKNKGYRANGDRHPHSWAIVDKADLISWILE
jgi:hypothetical protein